VRSSGFGGEGKLRRTNYQGRKRKAAQGEACAQWERGRLGAARYSTPSTSSGRAFEDAPELKMRLHWSAGETVNSYTVKRYGCQGGGIGPGGEKWSVVGDPWSEVHWQSQWAGRMALQAGEWRPGGRPKPKTESGKPGRRRRGRGKSGAWKSPRPKERPLREGECRTRAAGRRRFAGRRAMAPKEMCAVARLLALPGP
jgi:hypothetical protein